MTERTQLVLTGERTLPAIPDERYWFQRHVVAYRLAAARARGLTVLDAGCGEGYGAAMIAAGGAARVLGLELDQTVVAHARAMYDDVEFVEADLHDLPLEDDVVDLAVSFQVIEHLHHVPSFLEELCRVVRPGGAVLISTPNRLTFTPDRDAPLNPFHVREFSADELRAELERAGLHVSALLGVHHGRALRTFERALRRPLPDVLATGPPEAWPRSVRALVHRVEPSWFELTPRRVARSLDLLAVCHTPRA